MADSDCIVIMGSNMAESHPVAFRWPMKAKVEHGAKIIHVDPRFTRTSAVADIHVPIRAGSDLIFLGGLVNHVLNSEKWSTDPFFRTWVVNYTNAATIVANSGADRTVAFAYAVAWTQHTNGVQIIGACALLQLLLGNVGRPGAGVMALRGHASIQGSTDIPTLYHSIQGYMSAPSALKKHDTLQDYLAAEVIPTGWWANTPKYMVSYLKSLYGEAATRENQFGYEWHPKILGDHSHLAMFVAMNAGRVKGMICIGQNPATSLNAKLDRQALRKLDWLVVKDNWLHETAQFWKTAPEIKNGEVTTGDIKTEVLFFPATQVAEDDGTYTNTQRLLQFHHKAAEPPGDCRSDPGFVYDLGKRLKKLYATSTLPRDEGFKHLVWDYESDDPDERKKNEPSVLKILKETNGFYTDDPGRHM